MDTGLISRVIIVVGQIENGRVLSIKLHRYAWRVCRHGRARHHTRPRRDYVPLLLRTYEIRKVKESGSMQISCAKRIHTQSSLLVD